MYSRVEGADEVVLAVDLKQFRQPDSARIRGLTRMLVLFDGRNIYDFAELSAQGFLYHGIGTASGGAL
ncbi:UDP binding domain-containing protein [Pseudomonas sp. G.S.17]|uniref:UDP binding domain-containing protein n=1 Tax=Pseudomonas sp. G.S.17 TaxID=3137451 RepID=UPI00311CAC84